MKAASITQRRTESGLKVKKFASMAYSGFFRE
jgi:hypothetical protein